MNINPNFVFVEKGTSPCQSLTILIEQAATVSATLLAAVTGKRIRCVAGSLSADTTTLVKAVFFSGAVTSKAAFMVGQPGIVLPFNPAGWFETNTGEALLLAVGAANGVTGTLTVITYTAV